MLRQLGFKKQARIGLTRIMGRSPALDKAIEVGYRTRDTAKGVGRRFVRTPVGRRIKEVDETGKTLHPGLRRTWLSSYAVPVAAPPPFGPADITGALYGGTALTSHLAIRYPKLQKTMNVAAQVLPK